MEENKDLDSVFNLFSGTVMNNLKVFVEEQFGKLSPALKDVEDSRLNIATLTSLLVHKKIIGRNEFKECFNEIVKTFGIVKEDGSMNGRIIISTYNFKSEEKS